MDELDRELGALADSYRPARQPPLGDLVARALRRRRRAAVLTSVVAVLAVSGAAFALAGTGGPTVSPPAVSTGRPSPTAPPTVAAPVGCGTDRISGIVDYIDFVKVGGLVMASADTYGIPVTVREADLGQAATRVTCSLEEETHGTGSTERMDDGTASFLPVGTTVSEVRGFDPRCRVAAVRDGRLTAYLASLPDAKTHQAAPCAVMPGLSPEAPADAAGDYRSAPAAYRDRTELPDCGSVARAFGPEPAGAAAVLDCFAAARAAGTQAEMRTSYKSDVVGEGTTYYVLRLIAGEVEMWQSGFADGEGSDAYWRRYTCAAAASSGIGQDCAPAVS